MLSTDQLNRAGWIGGVVVVIALSACQRRPLDEPPPARETPPPPFAGLVNTTPRGAVLAYGRSLQFDTSHAAADAQHLVVRRDGQLVIGPYALLAPEMGSAGMQRSSLGAGRIVARITTDGPYPELGLATGENYMWVDSVQGGWRVVFVPADSSQPMASRPMGYREHRRVTPLAREPASARWTGTDQPEPCWPCWPVGWCDTEMNAPITLIQ